jgi:HptB-dependent secretion and biofilm anti anti-sigma factor
MAMSITAQVMADKARLSLQGRFDFSAHRDFRQGYEKLILQPEVKCVEVNMSGVQYIDSSALGMLLVLREAVIRNQQQLMITNCTSSVRRVLDVANFGKLFVLC